MDGLLAEPGHTIMVTHVSIIGVAILHVLGAQLSAYRKIDIEPLSITEIRGDGHRWVLRSSGVVVHARP
jgi:broad specificity phosphatase PhoE